MPIEELYQWTSCTTEAAVAAVGEYQLLDLRDRAAIDAFLATLSRLSLLLK